MREQMVIRVEEAEDVPAIRTVHQAALRDQEARLVDLLRAGSGYGPSLVAEVGGEVVGHVLFSEADLIEGDARRTVLTLAPLSVLPEHQGRGIGSALAREGLGRVRLPVTVLGDPAYYARFGCEPATHHGIDWDWVEEPTSDEFMVWFPDGDWSEYRGRIHYPTAFDVT